MHVVIARAYSTIKASVKMALVSATHSFMGWEQGKYMIVDRLTCPGLCNVIPAGVAGGMHTALTIESQNSGLQLQSI